MPLAGLTRRTPAREGPVHPRPRLVRDDAWTDLSGEWAFAYDDADVGLAQGWQDRPEEFDRVIRVPYPPESKLSGIQDPTHHPVVWYRREIVVPDLAAGERLLLQLGAVDYEAGVWVNGVLVGRHEGGHTPFTCDVTHVLRDGGGRSGGRRGGGKRGVVVVRAEDQPADVGQPRGKQDWRLEPHDIWYHRTTGIWQPVWLERVPATHIVQTHWTADVAAARARLEVVLNRVPETPCTLHVVLRHEGRVLAEETVRVTDRLVYADVGIPALRHGRERNDLLWSPASPTLLDAEVSVMDPRTDVADRTTGYVGLRTVGIEDGRLILNGHSVYLRGVLAQGYWPESHLAAPDDAALRREVELVKRLGFNAVRVHQKVEDPRFLYWCDRLGLLVWEEMPSAYSFGTETVERLTREWLQVLGRDRSHPCIVTWVPMNESWGVDDIAGEPAQRSCATALYHLAKAVDPTRPVVTNDGWEQPDSDIWGVHDYAVRGERLRERYGSAESVERTLGRGRPQRRRVVLGHDADLSRPVVLSEFGGVRFDPAGGDDGWGYASVDSADAFADRLTELFTAVWASPVLAGFCYTQLTDTEQEQNGLLTAAREPKIPAAQVRRIVLGRQ